MYRLSTVAFVPRRSLTETHNTRKPCNRQGAVILKVVRFAVERRDIFCIRIFHALCHVNIETAEWDKNADFQIYSLLCLSS